MKTKNLLLATALFAAVSGNVYAANALEPLFATNGATLVSDNSAEFFIDVDTDGLVSVGDIVVTIAGYNTIGATTIGSGTAFNELTSLSAAVITAAGDVDLGPAGADDSFGIQDIDLWQFQFGALTATEASYFNWATGEINLDGAGAADFTFTPQGGSNDGLLFGYLYEDAAQNYTRDGTIQAGITSASDGTLRMTIELDPANGDIFTAIAPVDVASFGTIPVATAVDNVNIALDGTVRSETFAGLNFLPNITGGNGGLSSPSTTSQFPIFDNLDLTLTTQAVPEPNSMLLLSLGLGLLGFSLRRNKAGFAA